MFIKKCLLKVWDAKIYYRESVLQYINYNLFSLSDILLLPHIKIQNIQTGLNSN